MAVMVGTRTGVGPSGGYPSGGSCSSLPVANLSASDRWRSLGGSEGALRQFADGCRWVGGDQNVEIEAALIRQCTEGNEAGNITDLNFHFKFITQISGLEQLTPYLRTLNLSTNNIRSIEGIGDATKLRELKLYGCQINRIQNLEKCISLISLHLEDNQIGAIEGLDAMKQLEYLNMGTNRVQKIGKGLAKLTKLKELHLPRNQLSTLDGIAGLSALETLSVEHNRISQVTAEHVRGLSKLDELRLAGNQLQSLGFLATSAGPGQAKTLPSLPSLVILDASSNRLTAASFRNLPPLQQLSELSLASNQIEAIEPCFAATFPTAEILELSGNLLQRGTEDLQQLKQISDLRELVIQDNPFLSEPEQEEVRKAFEDFSSLEFLDDRPIEKKVEAQVLALEEGGEDTETFRLTLTSGVSTGQQQDGKARPTSAIGSRPSTAGSRPGTAQKMSEAGVKDPLMHLKQKVTQKRYASEEQVLQWERQTISGLLAVEKQIAKTSQHIDSDMRDMTKFLSKADKILEREKELNGKKPPSPSGADVGEIPSLRSAAVDRANAALLEEEKDLEPRRASRIQFRLQEAVQRGRDDGSDEDGDEIDAPPVAPLSPCPSSPSSSPLRAAPASAAAVAFDEEIEEEEDHAPVETPAASSPEPAEEVEEELHVDTGEAALKLGPRAARAAAAVAARGLGESAAGARGGAEQAELRVEARAKDRGFPVPRRSVVESPGRPASGNSQGTRPGSQGSQGRAQPSQGARSRPPGMPTRSNSRGSRR